MTKLAMISPVVSEKAYAQSLNNVYTFNAPVSLNKNEIRDAIESQFNVTVVSIKTQIQTGKSIRFSRGKKRFPGLTKRRDTKKVYATLKSGDSLPVFDTVEQNEGGK